MRSRREALFARTRVLWLLLLCLLRPAAAQIEVPVSGTVVDAQGKPIAGAVVEVLEGGRKCIVHTGRDGHFAFAQGVAGGGMLVIRAPTFQTLSKTLSAGSGDRVFEVQLAAAIMDRQSIAVTADVNDLDVLSPDPAERVFVRQDLLDANPGRPGAPVSIPGYPIETASSGIKAPQYFAPGVAGDHGEPIAQYIRVGSYLVPNNLSANAHGNGYADPNVFIPEVLESVQVDGGAYNVRQGNHAVNLAATYGLRERLEPFATVTGDAKDVDLVAGFSPSARAFVAFEGSFGNGFLKHLEHRQQYKMNGQRVFHPGHHELTVLGMAYWGTSYIPGLVPLAPAVAGEFVNVGDTIDPRQRDQTHSALMAASDLWQLSGRQQVQVSGFFRTYNLSLYSDFGQGLIRQSEFRTVTGLSTNYAGRVSERLSFLAGVDYNREAPRRDNLDHYDFYVPGTLTYGPFTKVDSNDVTISSVTPYAAASGSISRYFRYYGGWRRDEIDVQNTDLIHAGNSFQRWVGLNSPKATLSFLPGGGVLPLVSASFGEAFFTEDPRIGTGAAPGSAVATAHSYQLVMSKTIARTDVKVTAGHVTTSEELAKIDPDTGLQEDQGPGRLRFVTTAVRRNFSEGSVLVTFSKADARDIDSGDPTPEAPRTIFDVLGNVQKLPFRLQARGEFEYVGRKTLGTGCLPDLSAQCLGVANREFRAAVVRPFRNERVSVGMNLLVARGFTGQTLESFVPSAASQVAAVRIPSYVSASVTYRFGRRYATWAR